MLLQRRLFFYTLAIMDLRLKGPYRLAELPFLFVFFDHIFTFE